MNTVSESEGTTGLLWTHCRAGKDAKLYSCPLPCPENQGIQAPSHPLRVQSGPGKGHCSNSFLAPPCALPEAKTEVQRGQPASSRSQLVRILLRQDIGFLDLHLGFSQDPTVKEAQESHFCPAPSASISLEATWLGEDLPSSKSSNSLCKDLGRELALSPRMVT